MHKFIRDYSLSLSLLVLAAIFTGNVALAQNVQPVVLKNDTWTIHIDPASLHITAQPIAKNKAEVSAPQQDLGPVTDLKQDNREASWELAKNALRVSCRLDSETLSVHLASKTPGRFTWPIVGRDSIVEAYILPLFEGSYVPSGNAEWLAFLVQQSPLNTTEGLSMPFWGVDCGNYSLTYILANPFNNELLFEEHEGRIGMQLTHEFTKNWEKKEYGLLIRLGKDSPVEPARQFRKWLIEQGKFVSLQQKIEKIPEVERLRGAAHIYLWGDALITRYDILDWKRFMAKLQQEGKSSHPSPGRRIWELMGQEIRKAVAEIASMQYPYAYIKTQVTDELSNLLQRRDFYTTSTWKDVTLPEEAQDLLKRGIAELNEPQLWRLNCLLLESAFPGEFVKSDRWGDGVSVKMMEKFAEKGFDRLWLGLNTWQCGYRHPQAITKAKQLGYLIAPYDSYHSIHHPEERDTWETAQFDLQLYETGAVVKADGTKKRGFKGKGYILSPIAARPYVEKRVAGIMKRLPERFNSWFIDCDAYGELYDDYSELHPATQQDDMIARLDRMAWIRDSYGLVIGSERGAAYAAPVIHFAHGMMTPVIGWGDPDLQKNKESKYYLGGWWPPDGPAIFVKQVSLKPQYRTFYFDPRFRLPLYQTVFHDSVVTTHHWGSGSLKFSDQLGTVELLELLYMVPPLYHMNLQEFEKHKNTMKAHYEFFSPLHREVAVLPLTDFAWINNDRTVQRTVFGNRVEMVANFAQEDFPYQETAIPGRSVRARWLDTGRTQTFTPCLSSK
jgi:hypothetical protein